MQRKKGRRRLDLPRDPVRIELGAALKREIPVIPVLVNGAAMPHEDDLPDDLQSLAHRHGLELRHSRFASDCDAIARALNDFLPHRNRRWRLIAAAIGGATTLCFLAGVFVVRGIDAPRGQYSEAPSPPSPKGNIVAAEIPPAKTTKPARDAVTVADTNQASSPQKAPNGSFGPVNPDAPRIALVIGNSVYPDADAPLKTPVNDARLIAGGLRSRGFNVVAGENLRGDEMRQMLNEFYGRIRTHDVVVLFFSGYGIQSSRQTYLIPVDARIWTEVDVLRDGFNLESILNEIHSHGADVKIVLIDASRRNPFERRFRTTSAGLAAVVPPIRTIVMYSGALSSVQDDSTSGNSLFVTELMRNVSVPDLKADEALNRARIAITSATRYDQVPWVSSSLAENFTLNPSAGAPR